MASVGVQDSSGLLLAAVAEMEDDEELFEIDIEAVNSIPPPHYWESYFTATTSTLLANCLLPISDVSSAIPIVSTACNLLMVAESTPIFTGNVLGIPCMGAFGIAIEKQHKEMSS